MSGYYKWLLLASLSFAGLVARKGDLWLVLPLLLFMVYAGQRFLRARSAERRAEGHPAPPPEEWDAFGEDESAPRLSNRRIEQTRAQGPID